MRRAHGDALVRRNLDPANGRAAAGEDQGMHVIALNHRQLEVTVVRRRRYRLPNLSVVHRIRFHAAAARRRAGIATPGALPPKDVQHMEIATAAVDLGQPDHDRAKGLEQELFYLCLRGDQLLAFRGGDRQCDPLTAVAVGNCRCNLIAVFRIGCHGLVEQDRLAAL